MIAYIETLKKYHGNDPVPVQVNLANVAAVESPINLGGFGGQAMGRNPVRIIFADGTVEPFSMQAYDQLKELDMFVATQTDVNAVLINKYAVNYVSVVAGTNGEWRAYLTNGIQVPVDGPLDFDKAPVKVEKHEGKTEVQGRNR